jgi:PilZ domain-containing protein
VAEAIQNPRRVPRAPARCEARCLLPGGGFWASDTTDFGPKGCQLHAPGPFRKGDPVKLVLTSERIPDALATTGTVAWASPRAPWRIGVSFDQPYLGSTGKWFDRLVQAYPGLATFRLAPDSVEVTATLRLGLPPRVAPDLSGDEVAMMRAVGAGATVAALRDRLGPDWPGFEGLLFAMIGRKLLTLDPAAAAAPEAWAPYLPAQP